MALLGAFAMSAVAVLDDDSFCVDTADADAAAVKELKLPDDPLAALLVIVDYLKRIKTTDENRFPIGGDKRASFGYVLSHGYILGLLKIRHELVSLL